MSRNAVRRLVQTINSEVKMKQAKHKIAKDKINHHLQFNVLKDRSDCDIALTEDIAKIFAKSYVTSKFHVADIYQGHTDGDLFRVIKEKETTLNSDRQLMTWDDKVEDDESPVDSIERKIKYLKSILIDDNGLIINRRYSREVMLNYIARHIFYMVKEGLVESVNSTSAHAYMFTHNRVAKVFDYFNYKVMRYAGNDMGLSTRVVPDIERLLLSNVNRETDSKYFKDKVREFMDDLNTLIVWIRGYVYNGNHRLEFNFTVSDFEDTSVSDDFEYLLGDSRRLHWVYNPDGQVFNIANYLSVNKYR